MADSIKEAVADAAESLAGQDEERSVEATSDTAFIKDGDAQKATEEDKEVAQSDEEGKSGEEESGATEELDERTISGHKLYDSLTGSDGHAALEELAKQFGRKLVPPDKINQETEKVVTNKVAKIFEKHMGDDYGFLAERIGSAMQEILQTEIDPRFAQQKQASDTKVMQDDLLSRMTKDNITGKNKDKVIANANRLLNRMKPQYKNHAELSEYVGNIYALASQGIKKSQDAARNSARITKNLHDEDAPSVDATTPRVRKRISKPNQSNMAGIREAVEAAAKGVRLED